MNPKSQHNICNEVRSEQSIKVWTEAEGTVAYAGM